MIPILSNGRRRAAVALLAATLMSSGATSGADAGDYLLDARKRYAAGDTPAAVIQLKNAIQLDPNLAEARAMLGRMHFELGNLDEAEKELQLAATLGAPADRYLATLQQVLSYLHRNTDLLALQIPATLQGEKLSEALYYRGLAYFELGQFEAADLEFARARDAAPRSGKPIAGQALVRLGTGRVGEANELIAEGLELAPESSALWQVKGHLAHAEGRLDQAIEALQQALRLDAANHAARLKYATTLLDASRFREAEQELRVLLKDQPLNAQLNYLHAVALRKIGKTEAAEQAIHRAGDALKGLPASELIDHPPSLFLAGLIAFSNGEFNAAIDYLGAFLDIDETHMQARRLLAASLIRTGRPLDAVSALRTLTSRGLADASVYALMGEAYTAAGLYTDAIKALDLATQEGGSGADILRSFGRSQIALGNRDAGIAALEQALEQEPDRPQTQLYLASMYLADGKADKALAIANRLLRAEPDHPVAMNLRGTAHQLRGDKAQARKSFLALLDAHPGFRPAELNLAKLDAADGNYSAARERVARLLLAEHSNSFLMVEMAKIELAAGDRKVAVEWLERARSLSPDDIRNGIVLTKLYLQMGETERAANHALQLKGYHPQNLSALENLALTQLAGEDRIGATNTLRSMLVLASDAPGMLRRIAGLARRSGDTQTASRALTQVVAADPNDTDARIALTQLALERGKLDDAKAQAMMIVDHRPEAPAGPLLLGEIALRQQQYEKALDYFSHVPGGEGSALVAVNRFRARMALDQSDAALAELSKWSRAHPDEMLPVQVLAETHHMQGDLKTAQVHYEWLLEQTGASPHPLVLNNLANLYLTLGDERALKTARQAHQLAPDHPQIQDTLASIYLSLGQPDEALPLLRRALAAQADSGIIRYHLALALDALGRRQEAIRELREALKRPDLPNAEEARAKLQLLESSG